MGVKGHVESVVAGNAARNCMNQSSEPTPPINAKREIVFIAGMHRSGTSAFTRVCNLLGGALPQPLVEPAVGNELGHWEPAEVVAMNDRALLSAGSDVNAIAPISSVWLRSKAARQFVDDVEAYLRRLGDTPQAWFIKDPRISLLAGLWRAGAERIGVEPRFVIAFRNPWEVAASLSVRQLKYFPDEVWPLERGLALWLKYMVSIERKTRGLPRSFVSYESLLGNWSAEIHRVYAQLTLPPPRLNDDVQKAVRKFLKPDERHARHEIMQTRSGPAMKVYDLLLERFEDPQGGRAAFDKAAGAFADSFTILGGYTSALEGRASQISALKARASEAEGSAENLRQSLAAKDLNIIHLARVASAERGRDAEAAAPSGPVESKAFKRLEMKHEALKAAHRQNVDAYKAQQVAWLNERDTLIENQASDLLQTIENEREAWWSENEQRIRHQTSDLLDAVQLERDVSRPAGHNLRQPGGIELSETVTPASTARTPSKSDSFATALEVLLSELRLKREEMANLNAALQRQAKDVEDGREAYEELRLEAAEVRQRLQAEINKRKQVARDEIEYAVLTEARDQLALIHRSRSWRITSPLRSVSRLFGRR